jgi:poly(glycerol-phosphate) alpha-glucosyltransferase
MGLPVTLDIVGDGRQRGRLEDDARTLGLGDAVRFLGYSADGAGHFADAAWTLLTSRSEGGSLVLLEAMAAGCLPVAYDIRYGAEVVQTRRNGWLVPDGDIDAAARAVAEACVLDDDRLAAMRRAAHRTAQARDEASVAAKWAEVQHRARRRHERAAAEVPVLHRIRVRRTRGRYLVTAIVARPQPARVAVEVRLRARDTPVRRSRMRSFGRLRFARLSEEASRTLGDGPVTTRFAVTTADDVVIVDGGTRHPDSRPLGRRVIDRLRRLSGRAHR